MNCPRCHTADLAERNRDGVRIDICRSCRGIWLDRGELERLIARANERMRQPEDDGNAGDDDDNHDDDDDNGRRGRKGGGGRQRGWWDIFD